MNSTFNFRDIFKSNFLNSFSADLSVTDVAITLLIATIVGIFIYQVYRKTFVGVAYSKSFNISLVAMAMITSLVITAVTSNIVLSLGMVGALSIVRFRTAVKDPMDIVFMFWAISVGIVTGAGLYISAIAGSLIIGLILVILANAGAIPDNPFLLVVRFQGSETEEAIRSTLNGVMRRYRVKSKTVTKDQTELTIEVRVKNNLTSFVDTISKIDGVAYSALVSYNGDFVS